MKVAAVIPAYNEQETIESVVKACVDARLVDEVLVVSDASTDATGHVAAKAGARVVENKKNLGKAPTMKRGVHETDAEIILFVDADLLGFTAHHADMLVRPVKEGEVGMCLGLRDRSKLYRIIGKYLFKVTGERALKREIFEGIDEVFMEGFMIEPALNNYCKTHGFPTKTILMEGVTIRKKYQKVSWVRAITQYIWFVKDVIKALYNIHTHGKKNT